MAITTRSSINVKPSRKSVREAKNWVLSRGLETSAKRTGTGARRATGSVPDALGRSIIWVTRQAVFWLASQAALGRLPTGRSPQWQLSGSFLAYSGGPAPDSHRLPVQQSAGHLTVQSTDLHKKQGFIQETPVPRRASSAIDAGRSSDFRAGVLSLLIGRTISRSDQQWQ
jgi:hypothetical protein